MDPLSSIHIDKDSTYAMMCEAQARGWTVDYIDPGRLFWKEGQVYARTQQIELRHPGPPSIHAVALGEQPWYRIINKPVKPLTAFHIILMRQDPPVDLDYIQTTQLLEIAQKQGVLVSNSPAALRDYNEKLSILAFPDCIAPTVVAADYPILLDFLSKHHTIVAKPLNGMGGRSIFKMVEGEANTQVILETLTHNGTQTVMMQRFIPEIVEGDHRILLIQGQPMPYALARIPKQGDFRGNLAAGATPEVRPLSVRQQAVCARVGPVLAAQGLDFVGLDMIGDYVTEINVTSPTCIQELDRLCSPPVFIAKLYLDALESRLF
jgi:glutathione synthase